MGPENIRIYAIPSTILIMNENYKIIAIDGGDDVTSGSCVVIRSGTKDPWIELTSHDAVNEFVSHLLMRAELAFGKDYSKSIYDE